MTLLKVDQLIITRNGEEVYNETFHLGVNIIRGKNSTGKSTIANFIFYGLGGEFTNWLPEARDCDSVFIQITVNEIILTLKRNIEDSPMRPLSVFYGTYEQASKSLITGWQVYGYRKSDNKESFSQVIFKALNFPEVNTDDKESITINQILRLLYVDQLSSINSLMRNEDFDSPLVRKAIGNLLLGAYDDSIFLDQLSLQRKKRELTDLNNEINAIKSVFNDSKLPTDILKVKTNIEEKKEQLKKLESRIKEVLENTKRLNLNTAAKKIDELSENLIKNKKQYESLINEINQINFDIIDSTEFLNALNERLNALNNSILTRESLGYLTLTYCPKCLNSLDKNVSDDHCELCKQVDIGVDGTSKAFRMKQELLMQIKESSYLLEKKKINQQALNTKIEKSKFELRNAQKEFDDFIKSNQTTRETTNDEILIQKGNLESTIIYLIQHLEIIQNFENLKSRSTRLSLEIASLELNLKEREKTQRDNLNLAYSRIEYYSLLLLKADGEYEDKFVNGKSIVIDFNKNTFYLDGRNQFSASSTVYLKNSIRFGIFFASLELNFFRYPRFILCDNMEDKGMVESRSKNFQLAVASLSNQFANVEHQIIFTTSMVSEQLDNENYTVGKKYSSDNKSLNIN